MDRRTFLASSLAAAPVAAAGRIPPRTVVLTFDDAVKSHRQFVAPLLKQLGFGATFFVTHRWMEQREHFMTWKEIGEIHEMGFEIGNHTWTHAGMASPRSVARLAGELALVDSELAKVKVPKPVSFAYPGNQFGPEAIPRLRELGFRYARRGITPEQPYGTIAAGAAFDPRKHHRLLIPTTGDAYPKWNFDHFRRVVPLATEGQAVVLQFHGVPDIAHPWVHTPPEQFEQYMKFLKQENFRVIALRDLEPYLEDFEHQPDDPVLRYRTSEKAKDVLPVEMEATRADLGYWRGVMRAHQYTSAEASKVTGLEESASEKPAPGPILPYPGGRHPRIGFLDGAVDPQRGTKASVFLPWDSSSYAVIDVPEAIFVNRGLMYLAHTHVPTIWNTQNVIIENVDWRREAGGALSSQWTLPDKTAFGARVEWVRDHVEMKLWLRNGTPEPLTRIRSQVCIMLKGAPEFAAQVSDNKVLRESAGAVKSSNGERWIVTAWTPVSRVWGNAKVPCLHCDPSLPDCAPGETVVARGAVWFHQGRDIESGLSRAGNYLQGV
ncbi:MAG: polysaccharide deacetylase family protein [Bryobacteraceae bacterium]